ncbi:ribonuclease H1 small subunit [Piedraia hortae CBS 480.64]|uniref:Ribonuclease H1 small subunit n=1 Tax=Piedraia hortae CBS 480.64 TaxID=1314780 RepID=A0A6A7C440_9PEZI|nr:ribonuclease H1 small subunit [Piedraia hortae CBS 480.64]
MWSLSSSQAPEQKVNLLPCSIKHDGPIQVPERLWSPCTGTDGDKTVYFRGRQLRGQSVKLPEGYEGAVLEKTDQAAPDCGEEDIKKMEIKGTFGEFVVWAHDALPSKEDSHVKAVEEWMGFAAAIHRT